MNLRQQIKKAKSDLLLLGQLPKPDSMYELALLYTEEIKLKNLIHSKRKKNEFYRFGETSMVDRRKVTHISLWANFEQLAILQSPNGRVLSKEAIEVFDQESRAKLYAFAKEVSISPPRKLNGKTFRNEYAIALSSDKQKGKKLELINMCWQHDGEDVLHFYDIE